MAMHTFSVTVETHNARNTEADTEELMSEVESNLAYESLSLGISSIRVAPITGTCRQQLIGEVEND